MVVYNFTKTIDSSKLTSELKQAGIPLSYINTAGSDVEVCCSKDLSAEQIESLDSLIASHTAVDSLGAMTRRILDCKAFGEIIMAEFAAENVLSREDGGLGLSQEEMSALASKFANVQLLVSSGSLRLARTLFSAASLSTGFDQARKDKYVALIDEFLAL